MKLKFGMVGGAGGFIGDVHRHAALMDDLAILTAGCFSRDMEKSRTFAEKWNITDPSRVYANYTEMAEKEAARQDGIDFVSTGINMSLSLCQSKVMIPYKDPESNTQSYDHRQPYGQPSVLVHKTYL